ncbi:4543_t:CDS:2, partial [Cetraspora pellucida]
INESKEYISEENYEKTDIENLEESSEKMDVDYEKNRDSPNIVILEADDEPNDNEEIFESYITSDKSIFYRKLDYKQDINPYTYTLLVLGVKYLEICTGNFALQIHALKAFAALFTIVGKMNYATSVCHYLTEIDNNSQLEALLNHTALVNICHKDHYFAHNEAVEIFIKYIKHSMTQSYKKGKLCMKSLLKQEVYGTVLCNTYGKRDYKVNIYTYTQIQKLFTQRITKSKVISSKLNPTLIFELIKSLIKNSIPDLSLSQKNSDDKYKNNNIEIIDISKDDKIIYINEDNEIIDIDDDDEIINMMNISDNIEIMDISDNNKIIDISNNIEIINISDN